MESLRVVTGQQRLALAEGELNEQSCVASCGVILGQATFFGSEAPNGVCVSLFSISRQAYIISNFDRHSGKPSFRRSLFHLFSGTTIIVEL